MSNIHSNYAELSSLICLYIEFIIFSFSIVLMIFIIQVLVIGFLNSRRSLFWLLGRYVLNEIILMLIYNLNIDIQLRYSILHN